MIEFCRDWYAWLNRMPPGPHRLHVIGEIKVGNPGIEALLTKRVPQGINPSILMLDLWLHQKPGVWIALETSAQARYDEHLPPGATDYTSVEVFHEGSSVVTIDVDVVP